jgi:hypothetical protein
MNAMRVVLLSLLCSLATLARAEFNVQALWWGAGGTESGWGLNIAQQGDILFATWFTYDMDGSAMWLVAPRTVRTSPNTYVGQLYRTTGPSFNSAPFESSAVFTTDVGFAALEFTDAESGKFFYTVNGISQVKAITRQRFDVEVTTCTAGGAPGETNYQDLWWHSPAGSESGWGVNLAHQGDTVFATWFTYDAAGHGMWIVMPDGRLVSTGVFSGQLYRTTGPAFNSIPFDSTAIAITHVGSGTFTFTDPANGAFEYDVNGTQQTKSITRQSYSAPATVCR